MPTPWEEAKQLKDAAASGDQSLTGEAVGAVKDFGRGVGKGLVGDVVGAGQLLDPIGQYVAPQTTTAIEKAGQGIKDWATGPSGSAAETIGRVGGGALPFMVGAPEVGIIKAIGPRAAPYVGRAAADALSTLAGHAAVGGASGAVQPTKEGESHLTNALAGAGTAGLLSPRVAGAAGGLTGAATAGLGVEELARRFGWGPIIGALSALGVGASHFGLGGLARKAYQTAEVPTRAVSKQIPAGVKGVAGAEAAEGAQENLDANGSRPAQGQ